MLGQIKPPSKIFYGWWIVLGAALGSALYGGVYYYGFPAYFDSLVKEFQSTRTVLSGAFSLERLEIGILGPAGGWLVDKYGSRKIMMVGVLLMGAGFLLLSRVHSIIEFYLVFTLMIAIGGGLGFSTAIFTAVGNWFVKKQGLAFGLAQSGLGLGGLLVPLVSLIISGHGWRIASLITGIAVPIVGLPIALLMKSNPEQYGYMPDGETAASREIKKVSQDKDYSAKEALKTSPFWFLSIAFSLRVMVTSAVMVHIMQFLLDNDFPREIAATALGSIAFISIAGRLIFGWLGDRVSKRFVIAGLMIMLAVSLVLLGHVDNLWSLVIFLALYAPAYGGLATLMQSIRGEYFGRKAFGTIMGFMGVVTMFGTVAGPLFAGYVWDMTGRYDFAFLVFAGAIMISLVLTLLAKRPVKTDIT